MIKWSNFTIKHLQLFQHIHHFQPDGHATKRILHVLWLHWTHSPWNQAKLSTYKKKTVTVNMILLQPIYRAEFWLHSLTIKILQTFVCTVNLTRSLSLNASDISTTRVESVERSTVDVRGCESKRKTNKDMSRCFTAFHWQTRKPTSEFVPFTFSSSIISWLSVASYIKERFG